MELRNEIYCRTMQVWANQLQPDRIVVTRERNCYIIWDTSLYNNENGGFVKLFRHSRNSAIEYAVDYGRDRHRALQEEHDHM